MPAKRRVGRHHPLITAGLIAAAGFVPLAINQVEKASLQGRIDRAETKLGVDRHPTESVEELRLSVAEMEERLRGSQRYVPEQPELAQALRGLTDALGVFEAEQQKIETRGIRRHAHFSEIPISVVFRGGFMSTFRALEAIESIPRMIRIDRLSISRESEKGLPVTEVELELSTFFTSGEESPS